MSRVEAQATAVVERRAARLAAACEDALPGARVTRDGGTVTIDGRGVLARLRWPAGLL